MEQRWEKEKLHYFTLGFLIHQQLYHCALKLLANNKYCNGQLFRTVQHVLQGILKVVTEFYFCKYHLARSNDSKDK